MHITDLNIRGFTNFSFYGGYMWFYFSSWIITRAIWAIRPASPSLGPSTSAPTQDGRDSLMLNIDAQTFARNILMRQFLRERCCVIYFVLGWQRGKKTNIISYFNKNKMILSICRILSMVHAATSCPATVSSPITDHLKGQIQSKLIFFAKKFRYMNDHRKLEKVQFIFVWVFLSLSFFC
jgi:hypothetical protein